MRYNGGMTTRYTIKGTTGDVSECGLCGRTHLRRTVALAPLDSDGNELPVIHAGTGCAGRAMARSAASVSAAARRADLAEQVRRQYRREQAATVIRMYAPIEQDRRAMAAAYFEHSNGAAAGVAAYRAALDLLAAARIELAA